MKYSLADCNMLYKFFNKDFFQDELGQKLGRCKILTDNSEAVRIFGNEDYETLSGISKYDNGKSWIWINKYLLDNKKLLSNTILHEMIHLYAAMVDPDTRYYRLGHGALWTKVANYATSIYGHKIGKIDRYADESEGERMAHYRMMHSTKTLANAFIVVLRTRDLVPIKDLSPEQIHQIQQTDARAIFKVKPTLEQSAKTRVKNYATFDMLMDDIEYGISEEEEQMYSQLNLKLGTDSERIWMNPKNK